MLINFRPLAVAFFLLTSTLYFLFGLMGGMWGFPFLLIGIGEIVLMAALELWIRNEKRIGKWDEHQEGKWMFIYLALTIGSILLFMEISGMF